jgi:hypothetical protein
LIPQKKVKYIKYMLLQSKNDIAVSIKKASIAVLTFSVGVMFLYPLSTYADSIFSTTNMPGTGTIGSGNANITVSNPMNSSFTSNAITTPTASPSVVSSTGGGDAQANAYSSGTGGNGGGSSGSGGGGVAGALGCSAGSILGQSISMGLKSLVGKALAGTIGAVKNVPIIANALGDSLDAARNAAEANSAVNAVQQINGIPIGASFNGIAYCIVNSIIQYVTQSTIAWAKSGFNGNPAFIQNPEAFFQTLANTQASQIISGIAYNTNGANACQTFRSDLGTALSQSYGSQIPNGVAPPAQISCSATAPQAGGTVAAPTTGIGAQTSSGGSGGGFWSSWNQTRLPENNLAGAYIKASDYISNQITAKKQVTQQEISNNNGYLNFKKCEDTAAAKKGDTSSCKTTTPGSLIQSALQNTINLAKQRLVDASKIDQVITAITNALIKKALNTVLDSTN